ncbi:ABC-three component system middle component 8 [uncultured Lutibacter sp.]|uniref:ABC-three component system middle component 8 n=1 Tax=uncultured Lutibacter sp. TaxID=437739 RepID=UPI002606AFED|nr:ABC-three component system middle component 8 [uncultured Lutibacter sp.]
MLTPTKHTNIKYSVIYIAGKVLGFLKKETLIKYEDLKEMLISEIGINVKNNIDYSLTFLFSIGKIEYLKNIDAITLINDNNED